MILATALIVVAFLYSYRVIVKPKYTKMSFKEALDLANLPIITFVNNNKKLNLLLDTGANNSVINSADLQGCVYTESNTQNTLIGMDGIERVVQNVELELQYKNHIYVEDFQITDMSKAFNAVKQETGVTLHGVIGNNFLQKYKYVLDFEEMIAYSKANLR